MFIVSSTMRRLFLTSVLTFFVGIGIGLLIARFHQNDDAYWIAVGALGDLVMIRNADLSEPKRLAATDNAIDVNLVWLRKFRKGGNDENVRNVLTALQRSWDKKPPSLEVRPATQPADKDWDEMRRQNVMFVRSTAGAGSSERESKEPGPISK